jgi:hypothetical protein
LLPYIGAMQVPAVIFGSVVTLLLVAGVLVVVSALRRRNRGEANLVEHGWQRLPDDADVVPAWDGWPFRRALEPGDARDVVVGHHLGARFMCLRWTQLEVDPGGGAADRGERERYNIVALATEHSYPHLTVVRGRHRIHRERQHGPVTELETGDARFDRRWQTLGDPEFGRAILTEEVRAVMDELDHAWVFQPGWVTRVVPWTFYAGEDRMLEELERLAAPLRAVPHEVWSRYGGAPRFLGVLGHGRAHPDV